MVQQSGLRHALADGHDERFGDKLGAQMIADGPTDHSTREQVDDHRQVQPALPRADIRDVGGPSAIGTVHVEAALQVVGLGVSRFDRRSKRAPSTTNAAKKVASRV